MVPIIGGALHSTGGCPLPMALVRSTERGGNHPMQTQFPQVPRDKQGTVKSTEPPSCPPSPLCQDRPHGMGLSPVGRYFIDLSLPILSKKRDSWIY